MSDSLPTVDSILHTEPAPAAAVPVPAKVLGRMKFAIIVLLMIPYLAFAVWCLFLLTVLPSPTGSFKEFLIPGVVSCGVVALVLFLTGVVALKRVFVQRVPLNVKIMSIVRVLIFLAPGLALAGTVPVQIVKEPALSIVITDPSNVNEYVAPISLTFSLSMATNILKTRGLSPIGFSWDFEGDGVENYRSVDPTATGVFERSGAYNVVAVIDVSDGTQRQVIRRVAIPRAVFSYFPLRPGVDEPVKFSVERLLADPSTIKEVQWDFNNDGIVDTVAASPEAFFTYLRTGKVKVVAVVTLTNQSQNRYEREIEIFEPLPPPFPVKIVSEPENLIGPPPLGTIFSLETEADVKDAIWDFGDGSEKARGERVAHNYQKQGSFQMKVQVHAGTGAVAELSKVIRVVESLTLPDLSFEGTPAIENGALRGLVPVTVNLTPQTSMPLIRFYWEAPGATSVGSLEPNIQAIYRRPGKYTLTLVAQDPDLKVLRRPLQLTVDPPASTVEMRMNPDGGVAPLTVRFDASETVIPNEEITGFEWQFGDDTDAPEQRGAQAEHVFLKPGKFEVKLKAFTTSGQVFEDAKTIVVRAPILDACFLPSRVTGKAPLGVGFDLSCTTGEIKEVLWDFGDGSQSDVLEATHVFEEAGTYKVTLTVTDVTGAVNTEKVTITVDEQ
ncbi:MAG: PKD domain-containing protein [Candidatus Peregrinibacteria bacterium]